MLKDFPVDFMGWQGSKLMPPFVRAKDLIYLRLRVYENIIKGNSRGAAFWARWLCRYSEAYLWQNSARIMPRD